MDLPITIAFESSKIICRNLVSFYVNLNLKNLTECESNNSIPNDNKMY